MKALYALLALLLLASCGAPAAPAAPTPTTTAPTTAPSASGATSVANTPAPTLVPPQYEARRIDVGGRELALLCAGSGSPTVLFEAGLGADARTWQNVLPFVAQFNRACAYDRAGVGLSDPAPTPRSSRAIADDLATLLERAGETGPFVIVAHSLGGLHARVFAGEYPELVAGMVLLDAVHEGWWQGAAALLPAPSASDDERLLAFRRFLSEDLADPTRNPEGIDLPASIAEVAASGDLGARPLVVVSANRFDVVAAGLPTEVMAGLQQLWQQELPARLAALSSDSTVVAVASGHNIPIENPTAVIVAIGAVIDSLQQE